VLFCGFGVKTAYLSRMMMEEKCGGLLFLGEEGKSRLLACEEESIEQRFKVEATPFARGKFALVKRALLKDDATVYAAKYIRKRRRVSPEEVWHEVSVLDLARDCPFIVQLYQVFETPLDTILLLEMAEGGDLQTILDEEEFLEESFCIDILRDTLKGLLFLHKHSIAHLDIKPQNLVATGRIPGGRVKLCDFGLSRHLAQQAEVRELFGTPDFVSPEVLHYEPITVSVDCWSIGVCTYVLLTGISPFGGESKQETYLNISQRALTFPRTYFSKVSNLAIDFIEKLLVLNPSERLTVELCLQHAWLDSAMFNFKEVPSSPEPNNNDSRNGKELSDDSPPSESEGESIQQSDDKLIHLKATLSSSSNGDQKPTNDDIDSGVGSEDDHRRNLSWARLDEVLENERMTSCNPHWLTLEIDEDPSIRNIWPNRKMKCSWEAECAGAVLRALDQLEKRQCGETPQAKLLRAYAGRSQVISKEQVGKGQVVIREFRQLSNAPALLTKHAELTCDTISTRINKLFN
jgi:serine/threonine protein kinase